MRIHSHSTLCVALFLSLTACKPADLNQACVGLGACDPIAPPPERVLVLCDGSRGSGCSPESLDATATALLGYLVDKPQSRLQIWWLGADVASTQSVAEMTISASDRSGMRAVEAHQDREVEDGLYRVQRGTRTLFDGPPPARSPILGALGKIALVTEKPSGPWRLVVISDGLQFGEGFDWECDPPRDVESFQKSIFDSGILTPDSFTGASFHFVFVSLSSIDGNRCEVEVSTARKVQDLWTTLLKASGATEVTFNAGPPSLEILTDARESPRQGGK